MDYGRFIKIWALTKANSGGKVRLSGEHASLFDASVKEPALPSTGPKTLIGSNREGVSVSGVG